MFVEFYVVSLHLSFNPMTIVGVGGERERERGIFMCNIIDEFYYFL